MRKVKIVGMGRYLPNKIVTSEEIDELLHLPKGWTKKKSGVEKRYYVENETASYMGAKASEKALQNADLSLDDIDCIVSTSGTMEQPIPCTASLIHEKLKPKKPIPAFDINSTCLSFVTGFDVLSHLIQSGAYNRILFVSTEIASVGINKEQKESYVLFGDGACACIITQSEKNETSRILSSKMETYSEGTHFTEIRGGGTKLHPNLHDQPEDFLFDMNGKAVFRISSKVIKPFVNDLLKQAGLSSIEEVDIVIPHQASGMAMRILQSKLEISDEQFVNVIAHYGNTIASSIPLALLHAIEEGRIKRGDKVMLIGTSAGLSIGGMILEY